MKDYLLSRLAERSTWAGLIAVLGAFGVWNSSPEQASAITALALAIFGGFNTVAPDRMRPPMRPQADVEPRTHSRVANDARSAPFRHPDER